MGNRQEKDLPVKKWPEWLFFDSVSELLSDVVARVKVADKIQVGMVFPFLDSVQESTVSLRMLINRQALRDSCVISRVIYETAVNACFLLTDPETLSMRANTHSKQKALRNLVRRIEIAGTQFFEFKFDKADELMQDPMHKKWLDEFTSKSGREITSWTSENVQQRLEVIYQKFGDEATKGLLFGLLLYRHASEIAHGTLYGTLFSWGAMEPNWSLKAPGDLGIFRRAELRHLLRLVCFSLESLIRVSATVLGLSSIDEAAKDALREYYRVRKENA